jgi:hypothetical protein
MVPESTVKRPSGDKTLRERIAGWRKRSDYYVIGVNVVEQLTPIAEALEAVVRDMKFTAIVDLKVAPAVLQEFVGRLERIVGQP